MTYRLILSKTKNDHYTSQAPCDSDIVCPAQNSQSFDQVNQGQISTLSLSHKHDALVDGFLLQEQLEAERLKGNSFADKVLAHGLNPVQSERVQHGGGAFHNTQHGDGQDEPEEECHHNHKYLHTPGRTKGVAQGHVPQHHRQLLMCQRQCPQTQV